MRSAELSLTDQIRMLSGSTMWMTQGLPGVPAVMLSDGPHGLRTQDGSGDQLGLSQSLPATCFPTASALANSWDPQLIQQVGAAIGVEARAAGVGVVLGPGMNIKRHPLCGRNFEYFSEDPLLTGRLAAAMVDGIQSQGVGACVKHFAVNNQEYHRFVVDAVVDHRTLRELYLAGFEYAVGQSSPWAVMSAYNLVNGTYCSDSRDLLTGILRDEWGFEGLVVSDWGATNDRVAGVRAGMDLEMPGGANAFDAEVLRAVQDGELPASAVATCVQRVLDLVDRCPREASGEVPFDSHDELARLAAARSTVLLANDGILPLSADSSLAVIGDFAEHPRFQGSGSSAVNAARVTSALTALQDRGMAFEYAPGFRSDGTEDTGELMAEAVAVASQVQTVVLLVGLPALDESEGFDRENMCLPAGQEALIEAVCAANPHTVVVISAGAPVEMPWRGLPAAIVTPYLAGQASGAALWDVLLGDVEPEGRLAESFPVRQADVASDPYFPGQPHQVQYCEGLAVGYRHLTSAGIRALFCFGHGLGYTTFDMGRPQADAAVSVQDSITVAVPLTNSGHRTGTTVVQVYVHDLTGIVSKPRRVLAGFAKVSMASGESRTVDVDVDQRAFAFYDVDAQEWRTPNGRYQVEVGFSCEDIRYALDLQMSGGTDEQGDQSPLVATSDAELAQRLGYPIPVARPIRPFSRNATIGEISGTRVGALVRRVVLRNSGYHAEQDPTTAKMLLRSVEELPLRAVALFGEGKVSLPMVDALVYALNNNVADVAKAGSRRVVGWFRRA